MSLYIGEFYVVTKAYDAELQGKACTLGPGSFWMNTIAGLYRARTLSSSLIISNVNELFFGFAEAFDGDGIAEGGSDAFPRLSSADLPKFDIDMDDEMATMHLRELDIPEATHDTIGKTLQL